MGVLSHKSPVHVTTLHYPTHAGRDARGPQIGTCPSPSRGMKSVGWARITLPSPVAVGGTRGGWGPREWKPHPRHNSPPRQPHADEGAGTPRDPHQRKLANALTRPHHRPMQAGMPADHRSSWTEKQSQGCEITRCQTIRGRWPGPGQGWWRSSVATQTHHAQVPGSAKPVRNIPPKARSRPAPSQSP